MRPKTARRWVGLFALVLAAGACSTARPEREVPSVERPDQSPRPPRAGTPPPATTPKAAAREPAFFESDDFIVTAAKAGDTTETLAERHLKDRRKKWMIEEYTGLRTFTPGQEVLIPKRDWNPVGVYPWGYQLVPVVVYHNISAQAKGKLTIAARTFEAHMRLLHAEGFHAVSLAHYREFMAGRRQLPRKSVVLTFDDGYRSFLQYARPLLKDLGFTATLFVYSDFVGSANGLSWSDLRTLTGEGFDVQAHSKSHANLRRNEGESQAAYAKRMDAELAQPMALFEKHLGYRSTVLAYPFGDTDEDLVRLMIKHGYAGGFTVRRQSNSSFTYPFKLSRSQIYAEMTPRDFAKNLAVFQDVNVLTTETADAKAVSARSTPQGPAPAASSGPWSRERLVALHTERAEQAELRGRLREALEERKIVLTIVPGDRKAQEAAKRLQARIGTETASLVQEGQTLLGRGLLGEAQQRLLAALSLDPGHRAAFETLQQDVREVMFITHTVRPGDTCASLAELYYGDRIRCEVIAETNHLTPNAALRSGSKLRIPEIPGVPFQLR
jgi:peptidoglycan/xylan/chitin deacetylase (PgdA/CDA1 family)